ncbi:MAG: TolC family protein [Bacteroidales bacterium]|nr:TolC family protein [Bacteroidales bacterium]
MRRIAIIALAAAAVSAQARTWNLDECVDYAIEHNTEVMNQALTAYQSELGVTEAKDAFLPELSGYASQSFNFGRGLTADNTYANRNTSSFSVGAQLSLPLFQGLRAIRQLRYSRQSLTASLERTEAAKDNVTLSVLSGYLQALYAREILDVATLNLGISRSELERRQQLLEAGKIPELDIFEARAQVSQDELSVVNARNDSTLAMLDLRQLLNLPVDADFDITPVPDTPMPLISADDVFANALARNHTIQAGRLESEAARSYVSVAKSGYIPRLSFNAGIGTNYYKTSGFDNGSFSSQMRHNFAKSLGFSLSVPIFDGFSTRNSVRRANAQAAVADLRLDEARNNLYKSINQAYTQAIAAYKKQEAADVSVASSRAALEAMQVKYDNGRANATEYEKARSTYTSALTQAVQAKYEAILRSRIIDFYNK